MPAIASLEDLKAAQKDLLEAQWPRVMRGRSGQRKRSRQEVSTNYRWSKLDLDKYKRAQRERLKVYSKTDDILYGVCRKWPDHRNPGMVQAKVRIIGRVYAAGVERKGEKDKSKGIYEIVSQIFYEKRARIDSGIRKLNEFKTLSEASHERILSLHGSMVEALGGLGSGTSVKL